MCLIGCDKTGPGAAIATGRLDIPTTILYSGTIMPGHHDGRDTDIVSIYEAIGAYRAGKIDARELYEIESTACPGAGACGGQYTANTMAMVLEFLGLSPAGLNAIPAIDPDKLRRRLQDRRADHGPRAAGRAAVVDRGPASHRQRHRRGRRHRRLHQRRAAPAGHRPRLRHPARHR